DWPVTIPAGRTVTVRLTGVYGPAESDEPREVRVAFTACALGADGRQPLVCATAVGRTTPGDPKWPYGLVLVVAAGASAALVWRRRHRAGLGGIGGIGGLRGLRRAVPLWLRSRRVGRGRIPGHG